MLFKITKAEGLMTNLEGWVANPAIAKLIELRSLDYVQHTIRQKYPLLIIFNCLRTEFIHILPCFVEKGLSESRS